MREASVMTERTSVGLDVHARSVDRACGLDAVTGEVWQRKLTPDPAEILAGCRRCRGRCRSAMRRARPGSGWPGT